MPTIAAVRTAVPPHRINQAFARDYARDVFGPSMTRIHRYLTVFDHAAIESRYLAAPAEWYRSAHGLQETNDRFIDTGTMLCEQVARAVLDDVGLDAGQIDHVIVVTTTGLASPSLDARVLGLLDMDKHTRRTPLWGLGCAGGLGGLARAEEYVRAYPSHRVLLLTVELCSLTLQVDDLSLRNLVAVSLFGDGAAGVVVEGDMVRGEGPRIVATQSTLFPDSLGLMGWDVVDSGFRVVFGTAIPQVVREEYRVLVTEFLRTHGLLPADISHHVYHPGGAKVLVAYQEALGLAPDALRFSQDILAEYGNMSSATIFFVLERFLKTESIRPGEWGLLCVFGPGFSAELVLIQG